MRARQGSRGRSSKAVLDLRRRPGSRLKDLESETVKVLEMYVVYIYLILIVKKVNVVAKTTK